MTYRFKVEALYLLGFSLDLINMFIANVAYPAMATDLGASVQQLAWVGNAYMLGLALVIPLALWLSVRWGERRLLCVSLASFTLGALLASQASTITGLIGWRFLQGLGGGLLIPVGQALAYRHCPPADRARMTARIMAVALLVPALAPTLGGFLVTAGSWRSVLLVSVPPGLAALALAATWIRAESRPSQDFSLDVAGLLLGSLGIGLLLVSLSLLTDAASRPAGVVAAVAATVVLLGYARASARARHPVLQWSLLRHASLRTAMLIYLLVPGTFIGTQLVATLRLHQLGYSAEAIGMLMVPWACASAVAIAITRHVVTRVGPRVLLTFGMLFQSAGIASLPWVGAAQPVFAAFAFVLMGLGGSLCSSTAQILAFQRLSPDEMLAGSSLWNINRQLSFCLVAAVLACVLGVLSVSLAQAAFALTLWLASTLTLLPMLLIWRLPPASLSLNEHPT
ncbi:EmrB/QacA subfamily drug resistance transporter [Luteibacter sp. Sphag1AF]|uniref:MFS transporter n=1 Tax=Luteibacter sp. Sphag1AF TaxID=2587031 RepID=UPI001607E488|nr:MFS transporter [Luteibacter sp. Sphag1AF]MBB3228852.1 EmrB/QacA subfamily drug resistance transporter [Luteibacter sp. Sphag1AF]